MTAAVPLSRHRGRAGDLHDASFDAAPTTEVRHFLLERPALVLGSTQSTDVVDLVACEQAGVEVVRRRSGGGAVLLRPGELVWFDVVIPAGAPGWSTDVHAPMVWLGDLLASVMREHPSLHDVRVHRGRMISTDWSRTVCFDGVGAGEVLLGAHKLLGLSQRRTRTAARLQCLCYTHYEPEALIRLLVAPRPEHDELRPVATLEADLADRLPSLLAARLAR